MEILCPVCGKMLQKTDRTYRCPDGHSFDIASQGYVNLYLHKSENSGDNKLMIDARKRFLEKDFYRFLLDELNRLIKPEDSLVDLACGEGYYTSKFVSGDRIGIDLSKSGLKIASKKDKDTTYILSSIFDVPLPDECTDKVTIIFAPIAGKEIARILKDNGQFILVKPNADHLYELKQAIYDEPYLNEIEDIEIEGLKLVEEIPVKQEAILNNEEMNDLFMMTPYWNTSSQKDKDKLKNIDHLKIGFSFLIDIYEKIN
ncbi:MAG: methyltransferase domain-containing protein [Erysipelotrichaceae bacterium]|nr:methyltransferase domain-containing protein [Erysipelotrichaceae bacterium]